MNHSPRRLGNSTRLIISLYESFGLFYNSKQIRCGYGNLHYAGFIFQSKLESPQLYGNIFIWKTVCRILFVVIFYECIIWCSFPYHPIHDSGEDMKGEAYTNFAKSLHSPHTMKTYVSMLRAFMKYKNFATTSQLLEGEPKLIQSTIFKTDTSNYSYRHIKL